MNELILQTTNKYLWNAWTIGRMTMIVLSYLRKVFNQILVFLFSQWNECALWDCTLPFSPTH